MGTGEEDPPEPRRHLVLVCDRFSENQLGRVHSLYLLARRAGYEVTVRTVVPGDVWSPLRGTAFAACCRVVTEHQLEQQLATTADVVVAVKPRMVTLGLVRPLADRFGLPLVLDMDDPDLEVALRTLLDLRRLARDPFGAPRRARQWRALRRWTGRSVLYVSNPLLADKYGGIVLPHARLDPGPGRAHTSDRPTIAFVGTPHAHKGIHLLRRAVAELSGDGYRLAVTAAPPADARPWESWVGPLSEAASMSLLQDSDIVALPSLARGWGRGQLPMKLIDAMLTGRGIAVSDLLPLTWAAGDGALSFPAGSSADLVAALRRLGDPAVRAELGHRARERALELTGDGLVRLFESGIETAVETGRRRTGPDPLRSRRT